MKTKLFLLPILFIVLSGLGNCDSGFPNRCVAGKPIVLINATLIDGTGSEPIKDAYLIMQDERILEAGSMNSLIVPAGSCILDVRGKTILPGFINCNVAIGFDAKRLQTWAQVGVTTVRDLGTETGGEYTWDELGKMLYESGGFEKIKQNLNLELLQKLRSENENARLIIVGPILTAPGGAPGIYPSRRYLTIYSREDARKKTQALLDLGVDVIHIWDNEFGAWLSDDEFREIVRVTHEGGKRVTVRARYPIQIERNLERGVDDFSFIMNTNLADDVINRMAKAKSYVVPCLSGLESDMNLGNALDNMKRYLSAGGKVALGDALGNPYLPIGMPMREFELMEEVGMTPMQIITASTANAAIVCNLGEKLGTLSPGKIADVIIINGDPLADIHNLKNIVYVFKGGKMIRKPESF